MEKLQKRVNTAKRPLYPVKDTPPSRPEHGIWQVSWLLGQYLPRLPGAENLHSSGIQRKTRQSQLRGQLRFGPMGRTDSLFIPFMGTPYSSTMLGGKSE